MMWNGIVSQAGETIIRARQPSERATQPSSTGLGDREPIAGMPDRLDRPVGPSFFLQASHADVDDVRAGSKL